MLRVKIGLVVNSDYAAHTVFFQYHFSNLKRVAAP